MSLSFLNIDFDREVPPQLDAIAQRLMQGTLLVSNSSRYRIVELEFYLWQENKHPDPYVHRHEQQRSNGRWYFHGSGLDITMGNHADAYGGILIRGICKLGSSEKGPPSFISGPLKVIRELFQGPAGIGKEVWEFGLEDCIAEPLAIYKSCRVGLNRKKDGDSGFHDAPYRYVSHIHEGKHGYKDKGSFKDGCVEVQPVLLENALVKKTRSSNHEA